MATYRVGESGATVFKEDGQAIATLRPGYVIEGTVEPVEREALMDRPNFQKRLRNYADKAIRPDEDK